MSLYDDLGVSPDATDKDIKKAYRSAAQKNHPDKGGDSEKFHQIQVAYDVLSNKDRRDKYNQTGETDEKKNPYSQVEQSVMELFDQIVNQAKFGNDIVKVSRDLVAGKITHLRKLQEEGNGERIKIAGQLGRILTDNDENLFENILNSRLGGIDIQLDNIQKEIDLMKDVLEYLNNYRDGRPPAPPSFDTIATRGWVSMDPGL